VFGFGSEFRFAVQGSGFWVPDSGFRVRIRDCRESPWRRRTPNPELRTL